MSTYTDAIEENLLIPPLAPSLGVKYVTATMTKNEKIDASRRLYSFHNKPPPIVVQTTDCKSAVNGMMRSSPHLRSSTRVSRGKAE